MTDEVSETLSWFANFTNFYSVLSVILLFCAMVVFILRLNGEHFMTSATHYNVVQEHGMMQLPNPFAVQLDSNSANSLKDGLGVRLSVLEEASTKIYWGVDITALQTELQLNVQQITGRFHSGEIFKENYHQTVDCGVLSAGEKLEKRMACPDTMCEDILGEPPRQLYPVVIVMVLINPDVSPQYTAIVAQFTVIHLKDQLCSLDSHIVYQFVKTNHDKVISLQPIFMTASDPEVVNRRSNGTSPNVQDVSTESQPNNEMSNNRGTDNNADNCENVEDVEVDDDDDDSEACCVCQSAPLFYTLLPCRHACVCSSCIKLLDRCPICRGYIDGYFRLKGNTRSVSDDWETVEDTQPLTRWQAFNQRLNEMLGMT